MDRRISMRVFIPAPHILQDDSVAPHSLATLSLVELCSLAEIPVRVTGVDYAVGCIAGEEQFLFDDRYYVGVGRRWRGTKVAALRVLEVLAHGFHDYAARECVCGKNLFFAPKRLLGRPPVGPRPMTARQRMAAMRARRASSAG